MLTPRRAAVATLCALAAATAVPAFAQSTDGYHSIQVFPVVVDTAAFVQRFNLHNNGTAAITLTPKYFPADGTSATAITCPTINIPALGVTNIASLRNLCPALPLGSQFGFLTMYQDSPGYLTYAAFSRVSNSLGAGFSVEGFAASEFTAARSVVTGLRRLAASGGAPAFQTNCFVGKMNEVEIDTGLSRVNYSLVGATGTVLGSGFVDLLPGRMVRLFDVFATLNVPAGDHDDVRLILEEADAEDEPGIISFCTVQDNTSLNADFRIGKQSMGTILPSILSNSRGPQDVFVGRDLLLDSDVLYRPFSIPAGAFHNTHVLYLHQPDVGQCQIIDPFTNQLALPSYGLEIRAVVDGETAAGGNNSVVVPDPAQGDGNGYFGDKNDGWQANFRVSIEVGSNGQNTGMERPYKLRCMSGSGFNLLDLIEYQVPGTTF
jgi:hypothetical protein